MAVCVDNPRLGIIGCGARYVGRQQHTVARVGWTTRTDGRAHLTFSNEGAADLCWKGEHLDRDEPEIFPVGVYSTENGWLTLLLRRANDMGIGHHKVMFPSWIVKSVEERDA